MTTDGGVSGESVEVNSRQSGVGEPPELYLAVHGAPV